MSVVNPDGKKMILTCDGGGRHPCGRTLPLLTFLMN